jgi:hypothetical protein
MNWDLHTIGKATPDYEMHQVTPDTDISKERAESLRVALQTHMAVCGPLCPEHGDPRDTNIDIGRE